MLIPRHRTGARPLFIFLPVLVRLAGGRGGQRRLHMAKSYDNSPNPTGPKKAAPARPAAGPAKPAAPANTVLAQAQRRAQQGGSKPPTSPAQFFQEAWVELKKTSWPNRDTLTKSTSVVLALVVAVALWVGGIDALLNRIAAPLFSAGR